jgi:enoyl-CoA hydratase
VSKVVPQDQLLVEAEQLLRTILANGPVAVKLVIEAVHRGLEMTLEEGLELEADAFGLVAATEDMKEGLTAFLQKRPPKFQSK